MPETVQKSATEMDENRPISNTSTDETVSAAVEGTKAYKGFDHNLMCRGFQYEVGKSYEMDGKPEICGRGFHACENPFDVLDHYEILDDLGRPNRFAEVEISGATDCQMDGAGFRRKICGTKIHIRAEISIAKLIKAGVAWIIEKTRPEKVDTPTETNDGGKNLAQIGSSGDGAKIGSSAS